MSHGVIGTRQVPDTVLGRGNGLF